MPVAVIVSIKKKIPTAVVARARQRTSGIGGEGRRTYHDLLPGLEHREAHRSLEPEAAPPEERADGALGRAIGQVDVKQHRSRAGRVLPELERVADRGMHGLCARLRSKFEREVLAWVRSSTVRVRGVIWREKRGQENGR